MMVRFRVNGRDFRIEVRGNERLLDSLRKVGMKSVKEGCSVGDCGSCNVIVNGRLVSSCMMLTVQARESEIATCEGLGSGRETTSAAEGICRFLPSPSAVTAFLEF